MTCNVIYRDLSLSNLHLGKVLKQKCISFTAPQYNSSEVYCSAPEHFLMLSILHWHKEDKKYLRAPAPGGRKLPV